MAASRSAGSCRCWRGLPPTLPGLGDRGQTRKVSSRCRSTGTARAPQAAAAARLPQHLPSPSQPLSAGLGQPGWDNCVFFPAQVRLCEASGPGPSCLAGVGEGRHGSYAVDSSLAHLLPKECWCQALCMTGATTGQPQTLLSGWDVLTLTTTGFSIQNKSFHSREKFLALGNLVLLHRNSMTSEKFSRLGS